MSVEYQELFQEVAQLAEIHRDLQALIGEQGGAINTIEQQIAETNHCAEVAGVDVQQASRTKSILLAALCVASPMGLLFGLKVGLVTVGCILLFSGNRNRG